MGLYKDQTDMAPYVSLTDLRQVEMRLPPSADQQEIAEILEPLDSLIEHNRQEIEVASQLAAALFGQTTHARGVTSGGHS